MESMRASIIQGVCGSVTDELASVTSERTETVACKGFEPLPLACAKCCNYLCLKALHRILQGLFTAFSTMAVACAIVRAPGACFPIIFIFEVSDHKEETWRSFK